MADAAQIVAAFREVASNKALTEEEMTDLVKDGMLAGLARIYGITVQAEIDIDEVTGKFDMVVLRRVVAEVEDSSRARRRGAAHAAIRYGSRPGFRRPVGSKPDLILAARERTPASGSTAATSTGPWTIPDPTSSTLLSGSRPVQRLR